MEKSKVIQILKSEADPRKKFNDLLEVFKSHSHHGPAQFRYYNVAGFTKENLQTLIYDVQQLYGITDKEVREFSPEETKKEEKTRKNEEGKNEFPMKKMLSVDFEQLDYNSELKPLAVEVAKELNHELPNFKKATLIKYLEDVKLQNTEVTAEEVEASKMLDIQDAYEAAPEEAKEGLKLRTEFPFLSEDDCPDKFKILVADKLTAIQKFEAASAEIQEAKKAGKTDGLFELGKKAIENFELNQEIYDELNYYQEHKEILGKHPIFKDEVLQKTVDAYSTKEAMKRQGNLRSYISRETPKLEKMAADKKEKAEAKIKGWQDELNLIDARLNEADKK